MKECKSCNKWLNDEDFYLYNRKNHRNICKKCVCDYNKKWRESHPELGRKRYKKEKNKILLRCKLWREKNKNKLKEKRLFKYKNNLSNVLFFGAKERAKKKNLEFSLKKEDIIIPSICPVLGIPLFYKRTHGKPNPNSPSIDRINNSKGYTIDNIIIVSRRANVLKNDSSIQELKKIISFYENLNNQTTIN